MRWRDDLGDDWDDVAADPPGADVEDVEDVKLASLSDGWVIRPTAIPSGSSASALSIYSTVTEHAEPDPAERKGR